MISNKNAKAMLDSSYIDETMMLNQLQDDRLDKFEEIERSLRFKNAGGYL